MAEIASVKGLSELLANCKKVRLAEQKGMLEGTNASGKILFNRIRHNAPRGSGMLARELTFMPATKSSPVAAIGSGKAYHWLFNEFGTVNMAARPFVGPAKLAHRNVHSSVLAHHITLNINAVLKAGNYSG